MKILDRYTLFETTDAIFTMNVEVSGGIVDKLSNMEVDLGDGWVGVYDTSSKKISVTNTRLLGETYDTLQRDNKNLSKRLKKSIPGLTETINSKGMEAGMQYMKGVLQGNLDYLEGLQETPVGLRLFGLLTVDIIIPMLIVYYAMKGWG